MDLDAGVEFGAFRDAISHFGHDEEIADVNLDDCAGDHFVRDQ